MLWKLFSFGHCIAEELNHHDQDLSLVNFQHDSDDNQSEDSKNHQKHTHFCHAGHTSIPVKSYDLTGITLYASKQLFSIYLNFSIKDVFLDGPFQPPRRPSFV